MLSEVSSTKFTAGMNSENMQKYKQPRFTLVQDPPEGTPHYLVFEIELPEQVTVIVSRPWFYLRIVIYLRRRTFLT